jgi:hypothetical protein
MSDSMDEETDNLKNFKLPNINIQDVLMPPNVKLDLYESDMKPGIPTKVNNGWSKKKEDKLKQLSEENQIYKWLMDQESRRYNRYDTMIVVPLILLSSCSALSSFISVTLDEDALKTFSIISGVVQAIIFALALTKQSFNPGKTSQIFSITSKKYSIMNNHFAQILTEDVTERINGTLYLREKLKELNDLYENTPKVSDTTWSKFYKELQSGNLLDINTSVLMRRAFISKLKYETVTSQNDNSSNSETNIDEPYTLVKTIPNKEKSNTTIVITEDTKPNIIKNPIINELEIELQKQSKEEIEKLMKRTKFQINRLA